MKRFASLLALAAVLAVGVLVLLQWDRQRPDPVAEADPPIPALPQPDWKLALFSPAWEPNAARNSRDLYAAYEQAAASKRPDAWLVAAQIIGACIGVALHDGPRQRMAAELGEYNSTKGGAADRAAKLANLERQQAALAELGTRCKGFAGKDPAWASTTSRALRAKALSSDSDTGRLLRALERDEQGRPGSGWFEASRAALTSANPVLVRLAVYSSAPALFDQRMEKPPFPAFGALLTAMDRAYGAEFDVNELDQLSLCILGGLCGDSAARNPAKEPGFHKDPAKWNAVVQQYEEALRARDMQQVLAVAP